MDWNRNDDGTLNVTVSAPRADGTLLVKEPGSRPGVMELGYRPQDLDERRVRVGLALKKAQVQSDRANDVAQPAALPNPASKEQKDEWQKKLDERQSRIDSTGRALDYCQEQVENLDMLRTAFLAVGVTEDEFKGILPVPPDPEARGES